MHKYYCSRNSGIFDMDLINLTMYSEFYFIGEFKIKMSSLTCWVHPKPAKSKCTQPVFYPKYTTRIYPKSKYTLPLFTRPSELRGLPRPFLLDPCFPKIVDHQLLHIQKQQTRSGAQRTEIFCSTRPQQSTAEEKFRKAFSAAWDWE